LLLLLLLLLLLPPPQPAIAIHARKTDDPSAVRRMTPISKL